MSYTIAMQCKWLPRFGLILALVFAQAVYAGHNMQHMGAASSADCSVCLHASAQNDVLPTASINIYSNYAAHIHECKSQLTDVPSKTNYSPPSRAPPVS